MRSREQTELGSGRGGATRMPWSCIYYCRRYVRDAKRLNEWLSTRVARAVHAPVHVLHKRGSSRARDAQESRPAMRHVWELCLAPTPRNVMPATAFASKATPIVREGPTQPTQLSAAPRPRSCSHAWRRRMTCAASASCDDRWSYLASCDMSTSELPKLASSSTTKDRALYD
jgi:hypothetical protein